MQTIEYRFKDKAEWPRGSWDDEPDKVQFEDPDTGLPCLIVRGRSGSLCGYVGVDQDHPNYKKDYFDDDFRGVDVHGGLTFAAHCAEGEDPHTICHIPGPGDPDNVWWLGFDTAHSGDLSPAFSEMGEFAGDTYKNLRYVKSEVADMAKQLAEIGDRVCPSQASCAPTQ